MRRHNGKPHLERRSSRRYPITAELEYRLLRGGRAVEKGSGRTVNISSSGILFEAEHPLPSGADAELSIAWPVDLNASAGLTLLVRGRIVRAEGDRIAISIRQHLFRVRALDYSPAQ